MLNLIILILFNLSPKSGEFLLDTNVVWDPAPDNQQNPSVAFNGNDYLVVWQVPNGIHAARVNSSGMLIDSNNIILSKDINYLSEYPSVASDGTNYFVVWSDGIGVFGARISALGILLDTLNITISGVGNDQKNPSVAFDGTNYLVVWENCFDGSFYDIYGARVNTAGVVLDSERIAISTAVNNQLFPAVAFDGSNYMVVWHDARIDSYDVYGARVTPAGVVIDTSGIIVCNDVTYYRPYKRNLSIAFNGANYLVVWQKNLFTYGTRISPSGIILTPKINICIDRDNSNISVASDDTNYIVVGCDEKHGDDIFGIRVTSSGTVLDTCIHIFDSGSNTAEQPSVAFGKSNYLVVWTDSRNWQKDIYGTRVNSAGVVLDPTSIGISFAPHWQSRPAIAFDGTNYLAVWEDRYGRFSNDIRGTRISPYGEILDDISIPVCTTLNCHAPSVGFDGTNYLVTWIDSSNSKSSTSNMYGTRITPSGIILDTTLITITDIKDQVQVIRRSSMAFDGNNYVILWTNSWGIYASRVTPDGQVIDSSVYISGYWNYQEHPSVAFDGTNYMAVWDANNMYSFPHIYGFRITPSLEVLDSGGIPISQAEGTSPSIAFDGTNYLVVWENKKDPYCPNIYAVRVDMDGNVLDSSGIPVCPSQNDQTNPVVVFDGTDYLTVWEENYEFRGAYINTAGTVIDSFVTSLQPGNKTSPKLLRGMGSQILLAYSKFTDSVNTHLVNTNRIWGKFYPLFAVEETDIVETDYNLSIYPNPVIKHTVIKYHLPAKTSVSIKLFDITGRELKSLLNTTQPAGNYTVNLNSKNLSTGIYFVTLKAGDLRATQKLVLMR